jgi:predicted transcriptional regulator of viral defense system
MKSKRLLLDIPTENIKATFLSSWLLSQGIGAVSTADISVLLGIVPEQVPQRMMALRRRNEFITPARGLWIPIKPEFRAWGAPPAFEVVDILMKWANRKYYVGWLSAADLLGASHHAPQIFQVAVSDTYRRRVIGRSEFHFYHRERVRSVPVIAKNATNGTVSISSVETTLLDICTDIDIVGGLDNVANLVIELCDVNRIAVNELAIISQNYPISTVRRLGWFMQNFTDVNVDLLNDIVETSEAPMSVLNPLSERKKDYIKTDEKWKLIINRKVEPDV